MFNMKHTLSFAEVRHQVQARADRQLPDAIVHVSSDLRMTPEGFLTAPGVGLLSLNPWSRRQLSAELGLRWDRWFQTATPAERADEVNRRLARMPGDRKLRATRDDTGTGDGTLRAFLAPSFTPIDDLRIFDRLASNLGAALDTYRFTSVDLTDSTSHYTAIRVEPMDLGDDPVRPGWRLRNSEVGGAALSLDDYWLRQVCANGLMIQVGGKRALYRTHRHIDDDHLAAALVIALGKLPERWGTAILMMRTAKTIDVPHPDSAVAAVLDSPEVPKALMAKAQEVVLRDGDRTRFGVVQAITYVAHAHNTDPDIRFAMERLAGSYLNAQMSAAAA